MAFLDKVDKDFRNKGKFVDSEEDSKKLGNIIQKVPAGTIERVKTGIDGFDELIEGGLVKNTVVLTEGGAGTGKSIFSLQFIANGITRFGENGVYISFEEEKKDFYQNMSRFGWDLQKLEDEGKFLYMKYGPEQVEKVLSAGGGVIRDAVESINAKRLVIDSMTAFTLLHNDELSRREAVLTLFRIVKNWNCTSLVIGQPSQVMERYEYFDLLEFECDGVIKLYNFREHNLRSRTMEVYKMRGTKHAEKTFSMEITPKGIVIYPEHSNI